MKGFLDIYLKWAAGRWAKALLFLLLSVLASKFSVTPAGAMCLAAVILLSYSNAQLALITIFAAGFLPYVWGIPSTAGFVIAAAQAPLLFFGGKKLFLSMAPILRLLLIMLFLLIALTFPFQRAADLTFLFFGLAGLILTLHFISKAALSKDAVLHSFLIALFAAFLLPFFANMTLLLNSPYFIFREHIKSLLIGRVTVAYVEPNVGAAYLAAIYTCLIFGARFKGKKPWAHFAYIICALLVLAALIASGSRTTLLLALSASLFAVLIATVKLARRAESSRFCWRSVLVVSTSLVLGSGAVFGFALASGRVAGGAIERLAQTSSLEDTGRPKSLRDAAERLDAIPYTGMDVNDYVLRTARHSPHNSIVATILFGGLWVAFPLFALGLLPIFDCLCGMKLCAIPLLSLFLLVMFLSVQAIPLVSDRGVLALMGVWFAFARFPKRERANSLRLATT